MSETLAALKAKYPTFTIRSEPSPTCPQCKGKGEYRNKRGNDHPCLCICISGSDDLRDLAAECLHKRVPASMRGKQP